MWFVLPISFPTDTAGLAEVGVDPVGLIDYADTIFAQVSKMKTCMFTGTTLKTNTYSNS